MQPWQTDFKLDDSFESGDFNAWTGVANRTSEYVKVTDTIQHHGNYSAMFASKGEGYEYIYCYKPCPPMNSMERLLLRSESGITLRQCDLFIVFSARRHSLAYAGWRRDNGV
jgi:hypothetical protein